MLEDKHNNKGHAAITETNFPVIMEASGEKKKKNPLGSELTAVIIVYGCICLHLPFLFLPVTSPFICLSASTVEMNLKKKKPLCDWACLELQCPLAKFITLRKKREAPCSF